MEQSATASPRGVSQSPPILVPAAAGWWGGVMEQSATASPRGASQPPAPSANPTAAGWWGKIQSNSGKISNSYATGSVASSGGNRSQGGGLVGSNNSGTISNSYATGSVGCVTTGSPTPTCAAQTFGGLVGDVATGTISDSYWDTTTGLAVGCGTGTCPTNGGLTTTQMEDVSGTYPDNLGDGFQLTDGEYPKVYQCTTCTGDLSDFVYSDELVAGQ